MFASVNAKDTDELAHNKMLLVMNIFAQYLANKCKKSPVRLKLIIIIGQNV